MKSPEAAEIRETVKKRYGEIARIGSSGCGCTLSGCCSGPPAEPQSTSSLKEGYSPEEIEAAPAGSDLGLGCGNPHAIAALQPGETVLDLGCGSGFDSFLAARQVGDTGSVIGVDMTPEMIAKARDHARAGDYRNVEFRSGEIEHLPVADASVDIIISNCVINLSPDKRNVFREAFRVLRPGGRLAISDVMATAPLPEAVRNDPVLYSSCVGGAVTMAEMEIILRETGFRDVRIEPKDDSRNFIREWAPGRGIEEYIVSAIIEAVKPGSNTDALS